MTTTIDRELFDLLNRVHEEGLIDNARRATLYDQVTAGRTLRGLDAGRYDLRREFDERFQGEREIDFPGTTALYRDIAEHGVFRSLMIKGRIELHERRIYEEFEALLATLTPVDMVPATPFITPAPLSIAGRLALVNEVLEHGIDSKAVILNTHNDGLNDGVIEAATAVRIDRGLRFHSEFFAETQDLDNDLFVDILDHGVISEAEYTALTAQKPHAADIDRLRRHFQLGDYRDVLAEEAAAAPFEVTGRELIVALAKINGVVAAGEHKRLTRLGELGSRMTEKQIRQCAEREAFVAEFGAEADAEADGEAWPYLVHQAIEYGLLGEAERDDVMRRDSEIDLERARTDVDYEPNVYGAEIFNAVAHDRFHAAAAETFTATPRPTEAPIGQLESPVAAQVTAEERLAAADDVLANGVFPKRTVLSLLHNIENDLSVPPGGREAAERGRRFHAAFASEAQDEDLFEYIAEHGLLSHDEYSREYSESGTPGYPYSMAPLQRYEEYRELAHGPLAQAAAPKVEGKLVVLNEDSRTYRFATGDIELHDVRELIVRDSGTHRLRDASGRLHVIATGWLAITIVDQSQEWTV